jgi:tungstate transport system ATP-binding protein
MVFFNTGKNPANKDRDRNDESNSRLQAFVLKPLLVATNLRCMNSVKEIFNIESFSLIRGEALALIGPNGAGKTSLLLTLALLRQPTSGTIQLDGITASPNNQLALRRRMAVAFQDSLLLDMSVRANLTTALRIRGIPRKELLPRTEKWLDVFGVAHLASRQARSLSGGEAQRTSLARAFALEPDLLFLDEPFASLDYPTRNTLLKDLGQILKQMNMTTLFVTHDYTEIPFLAERTAVMYEGRILKCGSNREVFGADFLERKSWIPWEN